MYCIGSALSSHSGCRLGTGTWHWGFLYGLDHVVVTISVCVVALNNEYIMNHELHHISIPSSRVTAWTLLTDGVMRLLTQEARVRHNRTCYSKFLGMFCMYGAVAHWSDFQITTSSNEQVDQAAMRLVNLHQLVLVVVTPTSALRAVRSGMHHPCSNTHGSIGCGRG